MASGNNTKTYTHLFNLNYEFKKKYFVKEQSDVPNRIVCANNENVNLQVGMSVSCGLSFVL